MSGWRRKFGGIAFGVLLIATPALAEQTPKAVPGDYRVRKVVYNKENVVALSGTVGVSTMIVFGDDEKLATVAVGDSISWQAVPDSSNRMLFVKPLERDAVTNMNVITNKRIYNFVMKAGTPGGAGVVYRLEFVYPDELADARLLEQAKADASFPTFQALRDHPESANFAYGFKGSAVNKPASTFDDGVRTYFKFSGEVPAIFFVKPDADHSETLVNYRKEGDWIVVDKVAGQFTLRNGSEATCIFNLKAIAKPQDATDLKLVQPDGTTLIPKPTVITEPATIRGKHRSRRHRVPRTEAGSSVTDGSEASATAAAPNIGTAGRKTIHRHVPALPDDSTKSGGMNSGVN